MLFTLIGDFLAGFNFIIGEKIGTLALFKSDGNEEKVVRLYRVFQTEIEGLAFCRARGREKSESQLTRSKREQIAESDERSRLPGGA